MSAPVVLITGAGGFVCSEIAPAMAGAGWSVIAVDRAFDPEAAARLDGCERIEGPLPEVLDQLGRRAFDAVIHGAAITAPPEALGLSRAEHLAANTGPLTAALTLARRSGAGRFLFLSSMGVFSPDDAPTPGGRVTEATVPTAMCAYCAAKRAGEILTAAAREPGFDTLSLRLGNTCGPDERARGSRPYLSRLRRMADAAARGEPIAVAAPGAVREWAWLPDLAQGIAALMREGFGDRPVLHAGTPPAIGDLDLARAIAERRPGAAVDPVHPPEETVRPPMGSDVDSPFSAIPWTPIEGILDRLVPEEVRG